MWIRRKIARSWKVNVERRGRDCMKIPRAPHHPRGGGTEKVVFRVGWCCPFWDQSLFPLPTSLPASALKKNIVFIPGRSKPLLPSPAKEINHTAPESAASYIPLCTPEHRKHSFPAWSKQGLCFPPTSCRVHLAHSSPILFVKLALGTYTMFWMVKGMANNNLGTGSVLLI